MFPKLRALRLPAFKDEEGARYILYASLLKTVLFLTLSVLFFLFGGRFVDHVGKFDIIHYLIPPLYFLLPLMSVGTPLCFLLFVIGIWRRTQCVPCGKNANRRFVLKIIRAILIIDTLALWIFWRTLWMMPTIPSPPEGSPFGIVSAYIDKVLLFKNDLFFSGHVGISFLGCLTFEKRDKKLAKIFLLWTIIMTPVVIVTRAHFTYDVLGAYILTHYMFLFLRPALVTIEKRIMRIAWKKMFRKKTI